MVAPFVLVALLGSLEEAVGASAWTYPLIAGAVAVDCVFPVMPEETVVIAAGVLAAGGELSIALVMAAGMVGSLVGDNVSYWLGASLGRRAERRLFRSDRARERVEWAHRQLRERGPTIVLVARFIPGGRTATTFSAGALWMRWRRFLPIDALAAALWAAYASLLGYLGGTAFAESFWRPLVAALIVATAVGALAELLRRTRLA